MFNAKRHIRPTPKIISFCLAITPCLIYYLLPVCYATNEIEIHAANAKNHPLANSNSNNGDNKTPYTEELTLDHIRDAGLALHEIERDVIYIFLEATRKPVIKSNKPDIVIPEKISMEAIGDNASYNPVRAEWLVYYIGILEPVIRLFQNDVNDTRSGYRTLLIPDGARKLAEPLWRNWTDDVDRLNEHLGKLNELIDETGKTQNSQIAKEAVAMFDIARQMERNRKKGYKLVSQFEIKRKVMSKIAL